MQLTLSYRNALRLRVAAFVLMLVLLGVAACKLYNGYMKVKDYERALLLYAEQDWVQAELYAAKVVQNRWISYKDTDITQKADELKPVTAIRHELSQLAGRIQSADRNGELQALIGVYAEYGERKKAALAEEGLIAESFAEFAAADGIEDELANALARAAEKAENEIRTGIAGKSFSDEPAIALMLLPADFYGGERQKNEKIRTLLTPYDSARIDAWSAQKGIADLFNEGGRLKKLYEQYGKKADWLLPKVEQVVFARLSAQLAAKDWATFFQTAKQFEAAKDWAVSGSKSLKLIQDSYKSQLAAADQLVSAGKFAGAVALYETLGTYRDTSAKLKDAELAWATADPKHLLQKAMPDAAFSSVVTGQSQFGALVYAAGITADNKLVLVQMKGDKTVDTLEASLDKNAKIKELRAAESPAQQGAQALLLQAASADRASRYIAYDYTSSGLRKLFDFEADGYREERPGVLAVDNDTGKGAGRISLYEYRSGQFAFSRVKPDFTDINLAELSSYKNVKVRFRCTISTVDNDKAFVVQGGQTIVLTGMKLKPGQATITGIWTGSEDIKRGEWTVSAMIVAVSEAQQ
ncbi:hypothetical protein PV433_14590 [Paenibacillus sp. GYB004]|uniref:hypothetical protein n=1 Tax=Paenibacillus sp. GYB004 TaxID=2994393 RepID=UPI002F961260